MVDVAIVAYNATDLTKKPVSRAWEAFKEVFGKAPGAKN